MNRATIATRWNLDAVEAAYERWWQDPERVTDDWRLFFEGFELGSAQGPALAEPRIDVLERTQTSVVRLIDAYRDLGHFLAHLDPLNEARTSYPLLELS